MKLILKLCNFIVDQNIKYLKHKKEKYAKIEKKIFYDARFEYLSEVVTFSERS